MGLSLEGYHRRYLLDVEIIGLFGIDRIELLHLGALDECHIILIGRDESVGIGL